MGKTEIQENMLKIIHIPISKVKYFYNKKLFLRGKHDKTAQLKVQKPRIF